jgi:hypothetical protein
MADYHTIRPVVPLEKLIFRISLASWGLISPLDASFRAWATILRGAVTVQMTYASTRETNHAYILLADDTTMRKWIKLA